MGYRGKLIFPFVARLRRIDQASIAADENYDDAFREARQVADPDRQEGVDARVEHAPIDLECQIEDVAWDQLRMMRTGNATRAEVLLVFHYAQLELLGLVDQDTGTALAPRVGDRLESIHHRLDLALVQAVPTPPGLYCVEAQPRSHGLSGLRRNLLVCTFRERETSSEKV
jgi:hypothetical protein